MFSVFHFKIFGWKGLLIELVILVIKNILYGGAWVKCYFIYVWFLFFMHIASIICFYYFFL